MPPETPPPDDERTPSPDEANVVEPDVLAERRAQRAEQAEQSATRRAADAQVLAAQLARERARLEAERDAARAEAAAAREGADVAIAEAKHVQAERDTLRAALQQARAERDALRVERDAARAARTSAKPASRNGAARNGGAVPPAWSVGVRRELAVARTAKPIALAASPAATSSPVAPVPGLARERRIAERRAVATPVAPAGAAPAGLTVGAPAARRGDRAAPITELALERERSNRLQAQLDRAAAVEQELREQLAALERAVEERVDAERRIEVALRRVREELASASALETALPDADAPASLTVAPPVETIAPAAVAPTPIAAPPADGAPPPAAASPALPLASLDPDRLAAARERLRAAVAVPPPAPLPVGPPTPWLTAALQRLLASEPETAGRIAVGLLPAQALAAQRPLRYDLLLAGQGCLAVDVEPGDVSIRTRTAPRPRGAADLRITADYGGFAKLLHGRRSMRRPARVRGGRRRLRELRQLARAPLGIRELASAGVTLDPALALRLVALAIDPAATTGHCFTIAHAPLPGGPVDAWLRVAYGTAPVVLDSPPAEPVLLTLRCTRGALLPLIAGVEPPPGESGMADGDTSVLALLRSWIAATEHPATA